MALTKTCVFLGVDNSFLFFFFLFKASMSAVYKIVGDKAGWNAMGTNYNAWFAGKIFKVGDTIGTPFFLLSFLLLRVFKALHILLKY